MYVVRHLDATPPPDSCRSPATRRHRSSVRRPQLPMVAQPTHRPPPAATTHRGLRKGNERWAQAPKHGYSGDIHGLPSPQHQQVKRSRNRRLELRALPCVQSTSRVARRSDNTRPPTQLAADPSLLKPPTTTTTTTHHPPPSPPFLAQRQAFQPAPIVLNPRTKTTAFHPRRLRRHGRSGAALHVRRRAAQRLALPQIFVRPQGRDASQLGTQASQDPAHRPARLLQQTPRVRTSFPVFLSAADTLAQRAPGPRQPAEQLRAPRPPHKDMHQVAASPAARAASLAALRRCRHSHAHDPHHRGQSRDGMGPAHHGKQISNPRPAP